MQGNVTPIATPEETADHLDLRNKVYIICVNLLVLTELCIAMFCAAKKPDSLTEIFFTVFFGMLVPTLIGAKVIKRVLISRHKI